MDIEKLISAVISAAYEVKINLGGGYLESVYQNALMAELYSQGLKAESECGLAVKYKGHVVGEFRADIVVDGRLIIELKAVNTILPIHEMQLVNYLTATGIDNGLLINFGSERLEVKRKFRTFAPKGSLRH